MCQHLLPTCARFVDFGFQARKEWQSKAQIWKRNCWRNLLRDATAASIWGAAAANDVIVITTKKGRPSATPQKIQINYSGFVFLRGQPDLDIYNMMSSSQLVQAGRAIFDIAAYPWAVVTTASSANSLPVVTPHEQISYDLSRGLITSDIAQQRFDSLGRLNNRDQVAYTFDRRYTLNASIRMDQSNLFGSDPSAQYRPVWSIGGAWNISNESFFKSEWVNNLKLRATYGLSGNAPVPGQGGPYDIVRALNNAAFAGWVQAMSFSRQKTISLPGSVPIPLTLG